MMWISYYNHAFQWNAITHPRAYSGSGLTKSQLKLG